MTKGVVRNEFGGNTADVGAARATGQDSGDAADLATFIIPALSASTEIKEPPAYVMAVNGVRVEIFGLENIKDRA